MGRGEGFPVRSVAKQKFVRSGRSLEVLIHKKKFKKKEKKKGIIKEFPLAADAPSCWHGQEAAHPGQMTCYHSFHLLCLKLSRLAAHKKDQNVQHQTVLAVNCGSPP